MSRRRSVILVGFGLSIVSCAFSLGGWATQRAVAQQLEQNELQMAALRDELARGILQLRQARSEAAAPAASAMTAAPAGFMEELKRQLQSEMGLFPVRLLRERRASFVELTSEDSTGRVGYGTAGYLGRGYFITVKHGVVALGPAAADGRRIVSFAVKYQGRTVPARLIDAGDADVEVHAGDWAIIKVARALDLPPLRLDPAYAYEFADPIVRLGNDYSNGIILSSGYVGQRTAKGLVTCLTDGHPGVSGGGVLNQAGDLVGIPVGRMDGDYRFSFILPLRREMFRKVASLMPVATAATPAARTND